MFRFLTLRSVSFTIVLQGALNSLKGEFSLNREKFIDNLIGERKTRQLTQKQVAEVLGISDRTYSKWETGETEPDIGSICRLAESYGISPAVFFDDEAPEKCGMLRRELTAMTPVGAMLRTREMMDEAFEGLCDNAMRLNNDRNEESAALFSEPLPVLPAPAEEKCGFIDRGNGYYLRVWEKDADLRLLLMPSEAGDAPMRYEAAELSELFGALSSAELISFLLTAPKDGWYSPEYLSRETGLPEERVRGALRLLASLNEAVCIPTQTAEGEKETYQAGDMRIIRGIFTLAHLILKQRRKGEDK
ncbi:MAG: helix-turn-helix transcriptional regulator [Oscillospiraceae bacterium]|nr:helix-turn-helix transcriptional regulator [Oscillospiraceae bacterium]